MKNCFPGGKPGASLSARDERPAKDALAALERENAELRASLSRQLEIAAAERRRAELAERSREEALRACARARLP